MYETPKLSPAPAAALARSDSGTEEVIAEARRLSRGKDFALILNPSSGIEDRLLPSYINAAIRRSDNSLRSRSFALEIMLFVSGTMNIGNAIERASARGSEFIIFSSSPRILEALVSRFKLKIVRRYKLKLHPEKSSRIAIIPIRDDKQR